MSVHTKEYTNEGLLYINNNPVFEKQTFEKGKIIDINGNIICPGEIIPYTISHEEFEEEIKLQSNSHHIYHYSPLQIGEQIRIYWNHITFNISTEYEIYPKHIFGVAISEYVAQIQFNLLDKSKCYYAIIVNENNKYNIVLTNIVDIINPQLQFALPLLQNITIVNNENESSNVSGIGFTNHIKFCKCSSNIDIMIQLENIKTYYEPYESYEPYIKQDKSFRNGIIFYNATNGFQYEFKTLRYLKKFILKKPYHISVYKYYVMFLNRCPVGKTFNDYYIDIHIDINKYIDYYPEHSHSFYMMSKALENYFICYDTDNKKIDALLILLKLPIDKCLEELINI